jgi:CheY-like chemotaxis protein
VLERATEPFFTTKEPGRGTGLGLSQVYGFVRQSDGLLNLTSEPGVGTTVRIYLPCVPASAASTPKPDEAPGGSGTILVVDDDPDVRNLVLAQLEDLGYTPIAASNGQEALRILDEEESQIRLLLTDMIMPGGLGGVELVQQARARRPGLKAVLTSGYIAADLPGASSLADLAAADIPLLGKPYRQEELAQVVRNALGRD